MYGLSIGSVTCTNRRHAPAPSMLAASYNCGGIDCNPASQMIIAAPAVHRLIRISAGLLQSGSSSQSGAVRRNGAPRHQPMSCSSQCAGAVENNHSSAAVTAPKLGLNNDTHNRLAATIGTIAGM